MPNVCNLGTVKFYLLSYRCLFNLFFNNSCCFIDAVGKKVLPVIVSLGQNAQIKQEVLQRATKSQIPIIHFMVSYNRMITVITFSKICYFVCLSHILINSSFYLTDSHQYTKLQI